VLKERAGRFAVERFVRSGMVVGLGVGSTAIWAVRELAEQVKAGKLDRIVTVAASRSVAAEARRLGLRVATLDEHPEVDVTIDGADEIRIGPRRFDLIKGGGGALYHEKLLAQASRRRVIVGDEDKLSPVLGTKWALPIEVSPYGWKTQAGFLAGLGGKAKLRLGPDGKPFRTDEGNYILDAQFGKMKDPSAIARQLDRRAGIVGHGLFLGLNQDLVIATGDGQVRHYQRGGRR